MVICTIYLFSVSSISGGVWCFQFRGLGFCHFLQGHSIRQRDILLHGYTELPLYIQYQVLKSRYTFAPYLYLRVAYQECLWFKNGVESQTVSDQMEGLSDIIRAQEGEHA
jgi:hypothetical protein